MQEPFYDNNDAIRQKTLADRARSGDSGAFSELVCLHRARILGVAKRIIHDASAAEDVVQEALVQAFLHMNRLADPDRFTPWLNRIVRNQALMKRRKDVRLARESTFTSMSGKHGTEADAEMNWDGLDDLLYRMTRTRNRDEIAAPEAELMRKEFYEALRNMLHSLSQREKEMFEAHFFSQLNQKEIADLLGMTEGSVYKSLSRLKKKVREERVRHDLRHRIIDSDDARERLAKMMLPFRAGADSWQSGGCSIAECMHRIVRFAGNTESGITDVMGWTGLAFRLNLERERIDVSGPSMYFWEPVFEAGLNRLGCKMEHIGDGGTEPSAYLLGEAVAIARRSIASGVPAIAWDLNGPEFGLLHGYDDDQMLFSAAAPGSAAMTLPYDKLGRGKDGGLFVMALSKRADVQEDEFPRLVADMIAHAYGERTFPGYVTGLNGYNAWMDAFRNGTVDPIGNAYCLRLALHAREHAVRFLRGRCLAWKGDLSRLAFDAEGHYYAAVHALAQLVEKFPFPGGGDPFERTTRNETERLLQQVKYCEEAGIEALDRLARCYST
ncbi:RNA polymerase sigma factor [Paenibacillus allorhizosphaerae]|uniref:RNA polymerase sigma factor n=1 Tax=Paenibacillus allorhizosphaerae TaxID=2849866 RepID=A0ABM8VA85_9BACL|nr:sigma-70 family RNA polymerase sigma factor [Paenibacillus allorhizosphaerae]CAG7615792.1 hypothetical protein PAECIP111802_00212 [Paenibacillus allorhizosphaerae]